MRPKILPVLERCIEDGIALTELMCRVVVRKRILVLNPQSPIFHR